MPTRYTVQPGDCIASIAASHGLLPDTIWDHPDNRELKQRRQHQHILYAGDVVVIPDLQIRQEDRATDTLHSFICKAAPIRLRLVLRDEEDQPRASFPYILTIDGKVTNGKTDESGRIELRIPAHARSGNIKFGEGAFEEKYDLLLGHLDPVTEVRGVQMRLANLGFYAGQPDGTLDDLTRQAIRGFQNRYGLPVTGEINDSLQSTLVSQHGS